MTTCIFVIVKNEHAYLDDFIRYHLSFGFDHIFVFEDVTSESHKEITDKYDKVSLFQIKMLFSPEEKIGHSQHEFIKRGVTYLKNHYDYDWCFVIDVDEYVTVENEGDTLQSVLEQFKDYDAVVFQWQNYGASGHVYKPDYSISSITETYTEKAVRSCNDMQIITTKTAYRLNKFTNENYFSNHLPSDNCKWCKTDFSQEKNIPILDKMYIRHYITKSWEEYVWKLYIRGMFGRLHRNYNDFFHLNPEMMKNKDELIEIADRITGKDKKKNGPF